MTTMVLDALTGLWSVIRDRHPELPAVAIVHGNPRYLVREAAWGHGVYPRSVPDGSPDLQMLVPRHLSEPEDAEYALTRLLHAAAHGLAHHRGITDLKDRIKPRTYHTRRFRGLCREVGLDCWWDGEEDGWSDTSLSDDGRARYGAALSAVRAALADARDPASFEPWWQTAAACGCDDAGRILAARVDLASAPPLCPECKRVFSALESAEDGSGRAAFAALEPRRRQGAFLMPAVSAALASLWEAIRAHHFEVPEVRPVYGEARHGGEPWGHRIRRRTGPVGGQELHLEIGILEIQEDAVETILVTMLDEAAHGLACTRGQIERGHALVWRTLPDAFHNARFRDLAAEVGLVCRWEGTGADAGWVPRDLADGTARRYRSPLFDLQAAIEEARQFLFPVAMTADCSCSPSRHVRIDSHSLARKTPHCPVCDAAYRPIYFGEL